MSRIHEAMQRAADQAAEAGAATPGEPVATVSDDIAELAREAFPIELGERRKPRTAPPVAAISAVTPPVAGAATTAVTSPSNRVRTNADRRGEEPDKKLPFAFERIDARYAGKTVVDEDVSAASREQYRRLAATLHHAQAASNLKVIMVTSAVMGEGKTLTSSNLALTLSESYQKQVLLIDADLRRPQLHNVFRVRTASGLSEGLQEGAERTVPVHQISNRLGILLAGRPTSDPIAGLTSARMRRLLDEARGAFDWVIVDTPPVALLPDANLLASMIDGAVIVVRAGSTSWDLVERAVTAIGKERTLGIVLNSVVGREAPGYYDYYYAPHSETETST